MRRCYGFPRLRILPILAALAFTAAAADKANPDKVPMNRDFGEIRREVETLRGKKFQHDVPVYRISPKELRARAARDLEEEYKGPDLEHHQELLVWLDLLPPHTDLKSVYGKYFVDQVDGFYDSKAKEMCIPSALAGTAGPGKKAAGKKLKDFSLDMEDIVLAHEFTHALEDQYWPIDDPKDDATNSSTDRGTAHQFVLEGSASREMIEVAPAQFAGESPTGYFLLWNAIHSDFGEFAINWAMSQAWKGADATVEGVPEPLAREEAMPYSYGYTFCTEAIRRWGLDGLDYVYKNPPVSSAQVMHPKKYWEWRGYPVQVNLSETLPGGWKQYVEDNVGEASLAVLFGCQFSNLNRGLGMARGWDGDHVAMYDDDSGHRLMLWGSAWDSSYSAAKFVGACVKERQASHHAVFRTSGANGMRWHSPDGRAGFIRRDGRRVIFLETDRREAVQSVETMANAVTFTEPSEVGARAARNSLARRYNPFYSRQEDGDFVISRTGRGLISRHDGTAFGSADSYLNGALAEFRNTTNFHKWEFGGGMIARHESDARRGVNITTFLPWGVLAAHSSARLPQSPDKTISRTSVLWGAGGSVSTDDSGRQSIHLLPFGLLLRDTTGPGISSFHILGTGLSREEPTNNTGPAEQFRLFGISIWTGHAAPNNR